MHKTNLKMFLFAFAAIGFFLLSSLNANAAQAATINVDSLSTGSVNGKCTLEDAFEALNSHNATNTCVGGTAGGPNTINLTIPGTYLADFTLTIDEPVTVQSSDATTHIISGQNNHGIFTMNVDGDVTFDNITFIDGNDQYGGAINTNAVNLTVTNSRFVNNTSANVGGAISMFRISGSQAFGLTLDNVEFKNNTAADTGSAIDYDTQTNLTSNSTVNLDRVTFHNNSGHSTVNFVRSNLAIDNGTFSNNTNVTNALIKSQNSTAIFRNNTFYQNATNLLEFENVNLTLANSIFTKNTGTCLTETGSTITSSGKNLSSDTNCNSILTNGSDLKNQGDLFLAPLAYGTSIVPTHALLSGSPAIDTATNANCPATDARGVARPFNVTCDMGAYELDKTASVALYRFFNTRNGEHLFTTDTNEANFIRTDPGMNVQWNDEEIGYPVEATNLAGTVAVYRLLQASTGYHHFTTDTNEVAVLSGLPDWTNEGIKFYAYSADASGRSNVDRFFNKINGQHLFTISKEESDFLKNSQYGQANWNFEKIEYYVFEN